ncbi:19208_t:CDS:2, partial [Racocetra fulgida]
MPSKKSSQWIQQAVDEHHIEFIPYDSFTKHEEIARGAYGEVTKAYWPTAEKAVALKSLFDNHDSETETEDDKDFDDFVKERAWSNKPEDRPEINEVRKKLEEMLGECTKGDNSVGSLMNNMNTLNVTTPNPPPLPKIPSNQQNNNANKRFSQNNVPPTYQPGGFNPSLSYNRSNTDPNLMQNMQNYNPQQIYQQPYANNNVMPQRPPISQYAMTEAHNTNMNQGMVAAVQQQQFPSHASNANYPSGMNNHFQQQHLYPTVNAGQSQTYPNINQHLMQNNFNGNQQQFKPIVHPPSNINAQPMTPSNMNAQPMTPSNMNAQPMAPSNMNAQPMAPSNMNAQPMINVSTTNNPPFLQSVPNSGYSTNNTMSNLNHQGTFNQQVMGSNQFPGSNYNQQAPGNFTQVPVNKVNQQVVGSHINQVPGSNVNQVLGSHTNQVPGSNVNQVLGNKYAFIYKVEKPTKCHAGYHAGLGDIEGLKYHLSCGESITSTYEFKDTNDYLCIIVARYCTDIKMVEEIFNLLRYPSGPLNDPNKQPNLSWVSVKSKRTVLHYLPTNANLTSDIDVSKEKKKTADADVVSEGQTKMNRFHHHIKKVIEFLVHNKCDINAKDEKGYTVLSLYLAKTTFQAGFTKVVEILLNNGADPNVSLTVKVKSLSKGSSAKFEIPHTTGNNEILDLLKEHKVDIDKEYENLNNLGNLLSMCLPKSKNGKGSQVSYMEGLEWVLNNVLKVCSNENLIAVKKQTEKN